MKILGPNETGKGILVEYDAGFINPKTENNATYNQILNKKQNTLKKDREKLQAELVAESNKPSVFGSVPQNQEDLKVFNEKFITLLSQWKSLKLKASAYDENTIATRLQSIKLNATTSGFESLDNTIKNEFSTDVINDLSAYSSPLITNTKDKWEKYVNEMSKFELWCNKIYNS